MEFIKDGDDASGSPFASHFPATEDNNNVNEGHGLPSPTTTGFAHPYQHIPLRQNDDDGVEFQRHLEDRQNDGEPSYRPFIRLLIVTGIVLMVMPSILGAYRPELVKLLPHSSILIKDINPLTMEYVKVEREHGATSDLTLFGFDQKPPLDVETSWLENHKVSLDSKKEVEWTYFLHKGSIIDITYNVNSSRAYHVYLTIIEGPSSPNILLPFLGLLPQTLLGGPIDGTGEIRQNIPESRNYYISVFNERIDIVEVELQIKIRGIVHNTTTAYYKCSVSRGSCLMKIPFAGSNSVLLAFDNPKLGDGDDETHVIVSYKPRWLLYLILGGLVVVLTAAEFLFRRKSCRTIVEESIPMEIINRRTIEDSEAALIPEKDGNVDHSDDRSHNGDVADNSRRLCAICFSAPRDSLFLPCGHCVSCYACGRKIVENTGICPICRRPMNVKNIYTV